MWEKNVFRRILYIFVWEFVTALLTTHPPHLGISVENFQPSGSFPCCNKQQQKREALSSLLSGHISLVYFIFVWEKRRGEGEEKLVRHRHIIEH